MRLKSLCLAVSCSLCLPLLAEPPATTEMSAEALQEFRSAIRAVTRMPNDRGLQSRARKHKLNVLNVLWEDTGRSYGSSVGPNISDVTLQVREPRTRGVRTHLLPVLRAPNFSDKTADVPADTLWVRVGNQAEGAQLVSVPLTEVLEHVREYITDPDSVLGSGNLLAKRDTHFLVSAQHVFVPISTEGKAEFNPVVFNYQSSRRHPAVLTLLCTREGTSLAVIENGSGSGQPIYFNNKGQRTTFTAERQSDVKARIEAGAALPEDIGALDEGADMLFIVQVPLKFHRPPPRADEIKKAKEAAKNAAKEVTVEKRSTRAVSNVEAAVIGHGEDMGPVVEGRKLKLVRDARFPVRVTVQFYKATSNGVISDEDLVDAKKQIERVYADADFVGSLVVPQGDRPRPTDWHVGTTAAAKIAMARPRPVIVEELPAAEPVAQPVVAPAAPAAPESAWQRFKRWVAG